MATATQRLHRVTSYDLIRDWDDPFDDPLAVTHLTSNDIDTLPWFYKRYPDDLIHIPLSRDLPTTDAGLRAVLAGTAQVRHRDLDLDHLGRVLFLASGVVRKTKRPYGDFLWRAAGSAGGRFPLELYIAVPEGGGLPSGVHWYNPREHRLETIGPPPQGGAPTIAVTGVPWRTAWRYFERGYRHIYWDAGTMLSQLLAAAASGGTEARLFTRFPDRDIAAVVGAEMPHEFPVALVALGPGDPVTVAVGEARSGAVDRAPVEWPLMTLAQEAGEVDSLGKAWVDGDPISAPGDPGMPVDEVVLARGSMRRMMASATLPREVLETSMAIALRGIDVPHFVAVHGVEDTKPGIYRWPDLEEPVRPGDLRDELYRVCLAQGLGRDAAFVVIAATDIGALDDRAYREAQLAAGLVEGRLHLLAYAAGAGASGMTFVDSEIPALLGEPLDGLLFTCVGVPEYRSATGGRPGAPAEIRTVTPRFDDQ